ncbi:MAG: metallophosphoesterase family protein [Saprospiraceae bacterium]|nr:metallophosphoesterase family protein [Saprospiraceae bacterium]
MKIGLLSDTHGFLDPGIFTVFEACDEIWHAGDFGTQEVIDRLAAFKPLKGVYGNIDAPEIQNQFPLQLNWTLGEFRIFMTHIAGYPGKYLRKIKQWIAANPCDLFICGHSHILKIIKDPVLGHLHINPGACGQEGFHFMRTAVRFDLIDNQLKNLEIIELGQRGLINPPSSGLSAQA